MEIERKNGSEYYFEDGVLQSVWPPETNFGMGYWVYMVPPFKPDKTLILGYGGGTIAGLIHRVWGDVDITGVDSHIEALREGDFIVIADAFDFVYGRYPGRYDYIVIDLFNGTQVPESVWAREFVQRIALLTRPRGLVAINTWGVPDNQPYLEFFDHVVTKTWGDNRMVFLIKKDDT